MSKGSQRRVGETSKKMIAKKTMSKKQQSPQGQGQKFWWCHPPKNVGQLPILLHELGILSQIKFSNKNICLMQFLTQTSSNFRAENKDDGRKYSFMCSSKCVENKDPFRVHTKKTSKQQQKTRNNGDPKGKRKHSGDGIPPKRGAASEAIM